MPLEKKERVSTFKRSKDASDSDSDSGPDDRNPPPSKKGKPSKGGPPTDSSGEPTWELGQNKKVKVHEYGIIINNLQMNHIIWVAAAQNVVTSIYCCFRFANSKEKPILISENGMLIKKIWTQNQERKEYR